MNPPVVEMPGDDFFASLRGNLVAACDRRVQLKRRGRRRVMAVAASAAALVSVVVMDELQPASLAAVTVTEEPTGTTVYLTGADTDAQDIQAQLRHAGFDVDVRAVPVGPSQVSRFVLDILAPPSEGVELLRHPAGGYDGFRVPSAQVGHIELEIGRVAAPGEAYRVASDAFAQDEPLACSDLLDKTEAEVGAALADRDLRVQVLHAAAANADAGAERLVLARAHGPKDVTLLYAPGGTANQPPSFEPVVECG